MYIGVISVSKNYNTEKKKMVIDFFYQNRDRHYTVSEIADAVLGDGAGKSTVYRQVSNLLKSGVIRRFETGESRQFVYQYADANDSCDRHYHLKCVKCGRLIHMECAHLDTVNAHIKEEHDFVLGSGRAVLYGECVSCTSNVKEVL